MARKKKKSSREKSPAFQFYPKDWLSDLTVRSMTDAERGAYIDLICHDWLENGLPESFIAERLRGLKHGKRVAECFKMRTKNGRKCTNLRLSREREKQEANRKKRQAAGQKGAKARWNQQVEPMANAWQTHGNAIVEPIAKNGLSSSISSSISTPVNYLGLGDAGAPPPTPAPKEPKTKTSVCTNRSIATETLREIITNPRYGDGDPRYVLAAYEEMFNWSQSGQKRKADWAATLRNWILRERKAGRLPHGKSGRDPKTFRELESDWSKRELEKFLADEQENYDG